MMNIEEIKKYVKLHKIKYKTISDKSGIPLGTLRNIFSNAKSNPRYDTIKKIEQALQMFEGQKIAEKYYTENEEQLIELYRKLSEKDKKLLFFIAQKMAF